jgi:hypothetical protein
VINAEREALNPASAAAQPTARCTPDGDFIIEKTCGFKSLRKIQLQRGADTLHQGVFSDTGGLA